MLDLCVSLLKEGIDLYSKSKGVKNETKLRISVLLEEISNVIHDTAKKIEKNEYPHFNCSLMEKMSQKLIFYLKEHLPENIINDIELSLREAGQVEKLFASRNEEGVIEKLYSHAANIKTISMFLKV